MTFSFITPLGVAVAAFGGAMLSAVAMVLVGRREPSTVQSALLVLLAASCAVCLIITLVAVSWGIATSGIGVQGGAD